MARSQVVRPGIQGQNFASTNDEVQQSVSLESGETGFLSAHHMNTMKYVRDSRSTELHASNAWSDSTLQDEPVSDDGMDEFGSRILQDEQDVLQNCGMSGLSEDADLADTESDDMMDDDMMDKISSSPSIDDEDIDFEFVYALHTFVATAQGQANATRGDTMVLLDDSNSYWWLVRIVKDSSIGYLPAEQIETPTERLARLNKHKNFDRSRPMLQDSAEKTKNPLKKAMRRRNAKAVAFTSPTYFEASDYDYSTEEEEDENKEFFERSIQMSRDNQDQDDMDHSCNLELLSSGGKNYSNDAVAETDYILSSDRENSVSGYNMNPSSIENFDHALDAKVSKHGTVRDTDSFFNDSIGTMKITLTPNLLRDDATPSFRIVESKERESSLDGSEKPCSVLEKPKEEKKKREKKPGMLSGLFKRKDKKSKSQDAESSDFERLSEETLRGSPQSKGSEDSSPIEANESFLSSQRPRQAKSTKRQRNDSIKLGQAVSANDNTEPLTWRRSRSDSTSSTLRLVSPESPGKSTSFVRTCTPESQRITSKAPVPILTPTSTERSRSRSNSSTRSSPSRSGKRLNNISKIYHSEEKPPNNEKARKQVGMGDSDSVHGEDGMIKSSTMSNEDRSNQSNDTHLPLQQQPIERLSESPVHISETDEPDLHNPPSLIRDTSSQEEPDNASISPSISPTPDNGLRSRSRDKFTEDKASISKSSSSSIAMEFASTSPSLNSTPLPKKSSPSLGILPNDHINVIPPVSSVSSTSTSDLSSSFNMSLSLTNTNTLGTSMVGSSPTSLGSHINTLPAWSDAKLRSFFDDGSEIRDMLVVIHDISDVSPVGRDHPLIAGLFEKERDALGRLGRELDNLLGKWLERTRRKAQG